MKRTLGILPRLALVSLIVTVGAGVGFHTAFAAPEKDYSKMPGYVDFDAMKIFDGVESSIEVYLKGSLLVLVREAVKEDDPELGDLLSEIETVRVQVFPLDGMDSERVMEKTSEMGRQLEKKGWEIAVRVREDDEQVHVYLLPGKNDNIAGMVVMVVEDDDEATFVNIVGNFDPSEIGRIGRSFHIDSMDIPIKIEMDGDAKVIIDKEENKEEKKDKKSKRVHRP